MGDDYCAPHQHFGRDCYRHHYSPQGSEMRCPFCGNRVQSVRGEQVARKHQDRYGEW